jgi:hypothetical protein
MSKFILSINTTSHFDSVEDARFIGQMVEHVLGEKTGSIRIHEVPTFKNHSLHKTTFDKSKTTREGQTADSRITSLVKNIRAAIPALAEVDFTEDVKVLDNQTWTVDYQKLFDNIAEHADRTETLLAFKEAVALTLQNEMLRGIK